MSLSGNIWKFDLRVECSQGGVQQQGHVQICRKDIGAHLSVFAQVFSIQDYSLKPKFLYLHVGLKGVYFSVACFPDVNRTSL